MIIWGSYLKKTWLSIKSKTNLLTGKKDLLQVLRKNNAVEQKSIENMSTLIKITTIICKFTFRHDFSQTFFIPQFSCFLLTFILINEEKNHILHLLISC